MKKTIFFIFSILSLLSLAACGVSEEEIPTAETLMQKVEALRQNYKYIELEEQAALQMQMSLLDESASIEMSMRAKIETSGNDFHALVENSRGEQGDDISKTELYVLFHEAHDQYEAYIRQDGQLRQTIFDAQTENSLMLDADSDIRNLLLAEETALVEGTECFVVSGDVPLSTVLGKLTFWNEMHEFTNGALDEDLLIPARFYFDTEDQELILAEADGKEAFEAWMNRKMKARPEYAPDVTVSMFDLSLKILSREEDGEIRLPTDLPASSEHAEQYGTIPTVELTSDLDLSAEDLELEEYRLDHGEYTSEICLVRNKAEETLDLQLTAYAFDAEDRQLAVDQVWAEAVGPGMTGAVRFFWDTDTVDHVKIKVYAKREDRFLDASADLSCETSIEQNKVQLELTNTSGQKLLSVMAYILFFDDEGSFVGYDYDYFTDYDFELKAGSSISGTLECLDADSFDSFEIYLLGQRELD